MQKNREASPQVGYVILGFAIMVIAPVAIVLIAINAVGILETIGSAILLFFVLATFVGIWSRGAAFRR